MKKAIRIENSTFKREQERQARFAQLDKDMAAQKSRETSSPAARYKNLADTFAEDAKQQAAENERLTARVAQLEKAVEEAGIMVEDIIETVKEAG